jgi:hypothetical protein
MHVLAPWLEPCRLVPEQLGLATVQLTHRVPHVLLQVPGHAVRVIVVVPVGHVGGTSVGKGALDLVGPIAEALTERTDDVGQARLRLTGGMTTTEATA